MVRIGRMASPVTSPRFSLSRRDLMTALGTAALCPVWPAAGAAQGRTAVALQAKADRVSLRPGDGPGAGAPETLVWSLGSGNLHFKRGEILDVTFGNELPAAAALDCRGLDGIPAAEPFASRAPLATGAKDTFQLPLRHAGTFLCAPLFADGDTAPVRPRPLIVTGTSPVAVDRDEVLLIEEWRMRPDGTAIPPGIDPKDSTPIHTINGKTSYEISAPANARLRLRFINGSQRSVLAVKLETLDVRVMAIDGQPAEPFPARNGALILAPGSRTDVFVDAAGPAGTGFAMLLHDGKQVRPVGGLVVSNEPPTRTAPFPPAPPLPGNDMPAQLDLKGAARFDVALGTPTDWFRPADFKPTTAPAFQAKAGRAVVLALTNRGTIASVFHLHGHHFRLLDKLDDGWKPFWLDTLAVEPGQTQRIAFLAEYPGRYLIEQVATDWSAPQLIRWYSVQ
ncbi:multicopper oxidase domain-containing protein [Bradyrhizobium sp. USDA 3364]